MAWRLVLAKSCFAMARPEKSLFSASAAIGSRIDGVNVCKSVPEPIGLKVSSSKPNTPPIRLAVFL